MICPKCNNLLLDYQNNHCCVMCGYQEEVFNHIEIDIIPNITICSLEEEGFYEEDGFFIEEGFM